MRLLTFALSLSLCVPLFANAGDTRRTNVVLILADDLGWSDLGCYGGDLVETPNIDRLAAGGLRFRQAYAMPVCSPTRAALMTGKHPARIPITIWSEGTLDPPTDKPLLEAKSSHDLPHTETTLAARLRAAGYLTAIVGKWHLGGVNYFPETHGFDVSIGGTHWGAPATYWFPYRSPPLRDGEFRFVPHLEFGRPGEYLTDRLTDEAISVIDKAGDKPFFLYLAHHAIHTPLEAKPDDVRYFQAKRRPGLKHQHPVHAAMTKSLDESVGRILAHLSSRGLDQNTVVIFTSDNGGLIGVRDYQGEQIPVTDNTPLRSGKGSLYEGGIRVPLVVRWPGVTPAGVACDEPVVSMDLYETLRSALAPEVKEGQAVDGLDLAPVLKDPAGKLARSALYFHYPHYYETTTPVSAVRSGDWKLLEYLEDGRAELFNLRDDESEQSDVSAGRPEVVAKLKGQLHDWRESVKAQMPTKNPNYRVR